MKINEELLESRKLKGLALAESWSRKDGKSIRGFEKSGTIDFLEGIDDDYQRSMLAQLYENTQHWLRGLDESTRTLQVGPFEKFVFPILRALMANLVAGELVTVSPLDAPTGLVFYFDVVYGSNKGKIAKGDKMFDVRGGPSKDTQYTTETVEEEPLGTGAGTRAHLTNTLAYNPIRPGTVVITDGSQVITDNGNGALTGDVNTGATRTIDYNTGAINVTFASTVTSGNAIVATYEYNSEANASTPEIDLQLTSSNVTARTQKLRARWSLEAQQDFQAYHGINAEVELVAFMANEIGKEINYRIIRHITQVAAAGSVTWDRTPPASVPWIWHKQSLYDALVMQSNLIFKATQRAMGNWIVGSVEFCNVVETLHNFKGNGGGNEGLAGVKNIGNIGDFKVFKDPTMTSGTWTMGHKGSSFLDTGYIYAPYLQLFTTDTIVLDDMVARKGMGMRNAQKVVNAKMFSTGTITQTGLQF